MYQHYYYFIQLGVDEKNKLSQGCLYFEKYFLTKDWNLKKLVFVVGTDLANAHMENDYFVKNSKYGGKVQRVTLLITSSELEWMKTIRKAREASLLSNIL